MSLTTAHRLEAMASKKTDITLPITLEMLFPSPKEGERTRNVYGLIAISADEHMNVRWYLTTHAILNRLFDTLPTLNRENFTKHFVDNWKSYQKDFDLMWVNAPKQRAGKVSPAICLPDSGRFDHKQLSRLVRMFTECGALGLSRGRKSIAEFEKAINWICGNIAKARKDANLVIDAFKKVLIARWRSAGTNGKRLGLGFYIEAYQHMPQSVRTWFTDRTGIKVVIKTGKVTGAKPETTHFQASRFHGVVREMADLDVQAEASDYVTVPSAPTDVVPTVPAAAKNSDDFNGDFDALIDLMREEIGNFIKAKVDERLAEIKKDFLKKFDN